jgi:hypothetical protein
LEVIGQGRSVLLLSLLQRLDLQVRIGEKEVLQAVLGMLQPDTSNSLKRSANGDDGDSQEALFFGSVGFSRTD